MNIIEETLPNIRAAVRKKPGMYFGCGGARAITEMGKQLVRWVVQPSSMPSAGILSVQVEKEGHGTRIRIGLVGYLNERIDPARPESWFSEQFSDSTALLVAGASNEMQIDVSRDRSRVVVDVCGDGTVRVEKPRPFSQPRASIVFQPDFASFGPINETELGGLAGILEDLAILNPGLVVQFSATEPKTSYEWTYPDGIRSWLLKRDHSRWPLHVGTLSFSDSDGPLRVEGHLRFLHAGVAEVRSWVNWHPAQGGAHYEGLGDVLSGMFPSSDKGCRRVPFVTNPDTNSLIWLPHCFIGAIKLSLPSPRYYGPTKDVLMGDEVRTFVSRAAMKTLPEQWAAAEGYRP